MRNRRYRDWFRQAEDDLSWARDSCKTGHFAGACFLAQQVAEKSLKALGYYRGVMDFRSHSVRKIAEALGENGELLGIAATLDQYYIATRYPDALPDGFPSEFFSESQALEALELAARVVNRVRSELPGKGRDGTGEDVAEGSAEVTQDPEEGNS